MYIVLWHVLKEKMGQFDILDLENQKFYSKAAIIAFRLLHST